MSINKAILIGNVGRDPELRRNAANGHDVASFSLATNKTWRDKATGERKQSTEWHRVVVFAEGLVKVVEDYVRKGSRIFVEGEIKTRRWTDRAGVERFTTEIVVDMFSGQVVLLDRKESAPPAGSADDYGAGEKEPLPFDDGVPF